MSFPAAIRNYNVFLDGVSYFGRATRAKTPDIKLVTEDHRGAGMDGAIEIDMGIDKMMAEIDFAEFDPAVLRQFGTQPSLTIRPIARTEGGAIVSHIETCRGLITGLEKNAMEGGKMVPLKLTMNLRYFRHQVDGETLHEIDFENGTRVIGGIDQTAEIRAAMGL